MGLLSLTPLLTGAAKEVYSWQDEARKKEDVYNENLAKAVNNVNAITQDLGKKYDDAVRLSNLVGGGSFANYLIDAESLDRLSDIYKLSGDDRDKELLNLKKRFDAIDKSKYEDLDFTETAKAKLEKRITSAKTEQIGSVGQAPTPSSKFEGFITQGVRKRGEQVREDIMTGITAPQPTAVYQPQEGALQAITSPGLTLKQKAANIDYFYNTLQSEVENQAGQATGEYKPNKGQEALVSNITSQANTLIQNGFEGSQDEAIAEVIYKLNNPDYSLPLLTQATPNSPIANSLRQVYDFAKSANNTTDMQDSIDELRNIGLENVADSLQQDYDSYVKSVTDEGTATVSVEQEIPTGGIVQKGKIKTYGATDYITSEQKLKNSQVDVTEEFIQQVMQKNNTTRNNAIKLLKELGYKKFPGTKTITTKGRIQGE